MYVKMLTLLSLTLALFLSSCAPKQSDIVLAEFGKYQINMKEFENAYAKNAGGIEAAKKDSLSQLKNFLNLYTDFKMKIRDAEVRGYDQDTSLQNELNDYKKKIGATLLLDRKIVEPGIENLYNKRKYELRVSHIMIRPDSTGDAAAKKLATAILDSIKNGASFEEMAKKHSQDHSSSSLGGDIYYLTAGMVPESFEDAMYATEPGHVYPHVVKTQYGYHIIKVTEKRERIPEIRVSHILITFRDSKGKIDSAAARAKIDSILTKLKNGADFAELAKEYSQDPGTKNNGGDIGFFQRRQMPKEFDEAAFNLKKVGDVSGVVRTRYGYHLIKLTDRKEYPSFEEDKEELKKLFQKNYYPARYDSLVVQLKNKYDFKIDNKTLDFIVSNSDSAVVGNDSVLITKTKGMNIYSYTGNSKDAGEFLTNLNNNSEYSGKLINMNLLKSAVNKEGEQKLLEKEALSFEKTDSAFFALINDYKDGIYIFKLQSDEIWNKINFDSTKLHQFYEENKANYNWPDRVSYSFVPFNNESKADSTYQELQNGANLDSLGLRVTDENDLKDIKTSDLAKKAFELEKPGDYSMPFKFKNLFYIIRLNKKDTARAKTFLEAKPEVASALQDKEAKTLEKNYIERLKERYKPVYHYDELTKAFKNS